MSGQGEETGALGGEGSEYKKTIRKRGRNLPSSTWGR